MLQHLQSLFALHLNNADKHYQSHQHARKTFKPEGLRYWSCRDEVMAAKADKESSQPSVSKVLSQRAQHHGLVSGLTGQNAAFSMAARLAVRWVAAHMMAGIHLPVEAIELLMTAAFLPTSAAVPPPGALTDSHAPETTTILCTVFCAVVRMLVCDQAVLFHASCVYVCI